MYICIYVYVYMYICLYVYMYICTYVHMSYYVYMYNYMYIGIYVHVYVYIYIHVYPDDIPMFNGCFHPPAPSQHDTPRLLHLGGALLRLQAIVVLVDDGQDVEDTGGDEDLESSLQSFFPEFSTGWNRFILREQIWIDHRWLSQRNSDLCGTWWKYIENGLKWRQHL